MTGIESREWGSPVIAAARAVLEPAVTPENERLLRTYHPSLSGAKFVYILTEACGREIWAVQISHPHALEVPTTHVAGMEVHVIPGMERPNPLRYMGYKDDWIPRYMNPRRMLTAHDLNNIRKMFPTATGVRVLISGYVIVLFQTRSDIIASWNEGFPDTIGGLHVGYDVAEYRPSTLEVPSGSALSDKPEAEFTKATGCLGLRLKLVDGVEAIATATHGFVYRPGHTFVVRAANRFLKAKEALMRFRTPEKTEGTPAHVKINKAVGNTPLGKNVWLAIDNMKVSPIVTSRVRYILTLVFYSRLER